MWSAEWAKQTKLKPACVVPEHRVKLFLCFIRGRRFCMSLSVNCACFCYIRYQQKSSKFFSYERIAQLIAINLEEAHNIEQYCYVFREFCCFRCAVHISKVSMTLAS